MNPSDHVSRHGAVPVSVTGIVTWPGHMFIVVVPIAAVGAVLTLTTVDALELHSAPSTKAKVATNRVRLRTSVARIRMEDK